MPILWSPPSGPPPPPPREAADPLVLRVVLEQAGRRLELGTTPSPVPSGSGAVWRVQAGVEGLDTPVMAPVFGQVPGGFGGVYQGMQVGPRDVFLRVLVQADGGDGWRAARRELDEVSNPFLGLTTITVSAQDGTSRVIRARLAVQQPIVWDADSWLHTGEQMLPVLFQADDPWWRQVGGLNVEPWVQPQPRGFFNSNFFPLNVPAAGVFGSDRPLFNTGQVPAQPVYVITAADALTETTVEVEHVESGRSWVLDLDGLEGTVTVDTATKTITGPAGADWWGHLQAPFDLWPFPPGPQTVRVSVAGTSDGLTVQQTGDTLHFRAVS